MSTLPRCIALKTSSINTYLVCIHEDGKMNGFLKFSGDQVLSPHTKYEVVKANSGKGLVHLRSCSNNKYWGREREKSKWVVARADKPDEDQSKWSCTLFEPVFADANTVRFRHVQLGLFACFWRTKQPYYACLYLNSAAPGTLDMCTVIDFESLMVLPKHVAFKAEDGNYLATVETKGHQYLKFIPGDDFGVPTVWNEIFANPDGSVHIKSKEVDKFWSGNPKLILADSSEAITGNSKMLFQPTKVENNVIALRNLGNNQLCERGTVDGIENCFIAQASTITNHAHLQVEELLLSRNIFGIDFRLSDARIYDETVVKMATESATNKTPEPTTIEMKLSYTETKNCTWNSSISVKLIHKSIIQSGVPIIDDDGKIKISDEFNGAYKWGKLEMSEKVVEIVYAVALPPMTMMKVDLVATKGSCDVPFSYSQRDMLINGEFSIYDMEDGVYTGSNFYNFKFESVLEPLL